MNKKKFIFLSTLFFAFSFNINDSYAKDQIYDQKLEEVIEEYDKNIEEDKSIKSEETSDDLELKDDSLNEKKGSEESEESNEITEKEDLDTDTSKEMIEDKTSGEILEENAEEAEEENYDNSIHTEVSSQTSNINKYLEEKESINIDKKDLTFGKEINLLSIKKQNLNKQELKNKWIIENGKKYYLGEDGKKVQGLYEIKGNTYYFDKNGLVVDKYIVLDKYGKYKIDSSGKATLVYKARPGWVTTKEDAYYFDQNNRLIRGRRNVGGNYYIFDSATGSILRNGFKEYENKIYYLDYRGVILKGIVELNRNKYYFTIDDGMVKNKEIVADSGKYQTDSKGRAFLIQKARPGWMTTKEDAYFFDQNNRLIRGRRNVGGNYYIFDFETGKILRNGFKVYDNKTYYVDDRGVILKGIVELNRNKYYFTIDDGMVKNKEIVADSGKYQTDSKGRAFLIQKARPGWMTTKEDAYFFDQNNRLLRGKYSVGGNYYIFDFETGAMVVSEYRKIGNTTYYAQSNGVIFDSWRCEKMIDWMLQHERSRSNVRYSMTSRYLNPNLDCSSSVYFALKSAGFISQDHFIGNTETLFKEPILKEIYDFKDVRRGDIFIMGIEGQSMGGYGHTGIFYDKDKVIHCNYRNNGITIDDYRYVLDGKRSNAERYFRIIV